MYIISGLLCGSVDQQVLLTFNPVLKLASYGGMKLKFYMLVVTLTYAWLKHK